MKQPFITTLVRFGARVTPHYVINELKAARFRIVEQYKIHHPYEGDYYEAMVEVQEFLPGYIVIELGGGVHHIVRSD